MVSASKPSNAKLTLFAKLNYLPSCWHVRPNKLHSVNQTTKVWEAFSIFRLVAEKIHFELGEFNIWPIFVTLRARKRRSIWKIKKASHSFEH